MTASVQRSTAVPSTTAVAVEEDRFVALHGRYCNGIWRYVRRLGLTAAEADDATQQVFFVVARKLDAIQPGAERAYVYAVASRVAADVRRGAARRYEVAESTEHADDKNGPEELFEERRRLSLLDAILAAMPVDLRQVFVLYEIEELSLKEIAAIVKVPLGTAGSRLRRAREEFKARAARYRKGGGT